jgi:hypothetical protein
MPQQQNSWSCSVYSFNWVIGATQTDPDITYDEGLGIIGYPDCVNPTYGLMSDTCMINAFSSLGLHSVQRWCTFDEAYSICKVATGTINPQGMYHFMGIRGVDSSSIWVANSALGYCGVYEHLDRNQFNSLGPVSLIYVE